MLDANSNLEEEVNRLTKENTELKHLKSKLTKENKFLEEEVWKYK